jgi:dolichol-phosphate mannosyltransferase
MKLGAVVPVFNEEHRIDAVLQRFAGVPAQETLFVDDGSTDRTPELMRKAGARVVRHERRRGVGACLRDGIQRLRAEGFDAAVILAGNGKDDPREIPKVAGPVLSGEADYVQGSRFLAGGSHENLPPARLAMIKSYTTLWSLLMGRRLTDVTNGFRAYKLSLLDDPRIRLDQPWLDTYSFEYYLHFKVLSLGYKFKEVSVTKNYPSKTNYSKIRPILDWWSIVEPLISLRLGLRK